MEPVPYISIQESLPSANAQIAAVSRQGVLKRRFLYSLLLSTWIPMAVLLYIGLKGDVQFTLTQFKIVLLFLGGSHVQATLFFYTDRDFRDLVRGNPGRYVYAPLALILGSGLLFLIANPTAQAVLFMFYWGWQTYHYGRQNVGVYSFASISQGITPPPLSRTALEFVTFGAMLGTIKVLGSGVVPAYLTTTIDYLYWIGFYSFLGVCVFGAVVYFRSISKTTWTNALFFITLLLFFLPLYLSNNALISFSSYAIAHGLQYLVFMTVVSANSRVGDRSNRTRGLITFACITLILGFACYRLADLKTLGMLLNHPVLQRLLDFTLGAVFGSVMAHFVIDGGAWRLKQPSARAYMAKRFNFLFARETEPTALSDRPAL